jgi:hypothetical protein
LPVHDTNSIFVGSTGVASVKFLDEKITELASAAWYCVWGSFMSKARLDVSLNGASRRSTGLVVTEGSGSVDPAR